MNEGQMKPPHVKAAVQYLVASCGDDTQEIKCVIGPKVVEI